MKVLRILRNIGFVILALIIIAAGIIYFKKDSLIRSAVDATAESLQVEMDYKSAGLSFFSTFPNVGVSFDSLVVRGPNSGDASIADIQTLTLGLGFWSLFSDEGYELKDIILDKPHLQFFCRKDTSCNYDVLMQESPNEDTATTSSPMQISIENFQINGGSFTYVDSVSASQLSISNWFFQLSGNYRDEVLSATVDQRDMVLDYISDGMKYTDSLHLTGNGQLEYDTKNSSLKLNENLWSLNALQLQLSGMLQLLEEGYETDLAINLPSNDFKPLLSLIPAIYQKDFEELEVEGMFTLEGTIKGLLDTEKELYPALAFNSSITNGRIKYPELPGDISDINLKAKVEKEEGSLDLATVNISQYEMTMAGVSRIEGHLSLSEMISNPFAQGHLMARGSLASVQDIYPMEDVSELKGDLDLNLDFSFRLDDLKNNNYENVNLAGKAGLKSFVYKAMDQPRLSLENMNTDLKAQGLQASISNFKAGNTMVPSIQMNTGPLGTYFDEEQVFPIELSAECNSLNTNEWLAESEGPESNELSTPYDFSGYAVDFDIKIQELIYSTYNFKNISSEGGFKNSVIELAPSSLVYQDANYRVDGRIRNIEAYLNNTGDLIADLTIRGGRFDLYAYMDSGPEEPAGATSPAEEHFYLPEEIQLNIDYTLDGIDYGDMQFSNVRGKMQMAKGDINISSTDLMGLGGNLNVEGKFNTAEGTPPVFNFNVASQALQFSNTFKSILTIQKIAPLLGKLNGVYDARISTSGSLDKELYPRINDLDMQGFIATRKAELEAYEPLSKLDQAMGTNLSRNFPLDNTKNWFAVEDGTVIIEPFNINLFENPWTLEGQHQIGGEMNYQFSGPLPVETLRKTDAGRKIIDEATKVFNQIPLTSGFDLKEVDVAALLSGTRNNPKVSLRLANDFRDILKERIQSRIQEGNEEVKEEATKTIEKTKEDLEKAAKEKAREVITGKKDTSKTQPADSLKNEAEEKLKKAKEKLQKWNPFEKKNG